jgi:GNAT superfamily N-acetyltransferase
MAFVITYRLRPPLTNVELNALFSVGWPSWQEERDTSDWQSVLQHSLSYVCAYSDERLVGFANVAWDGRAHAFLLDPRVHPDFRHQGIGTELVRRAGRTAQAAGCEWLHVDYAPELAPFYEACGFRPTMAGVIRVADDGQHK